jgi:hypothetical protein
MGSQCFKKLQVLHKLYKQLGKQMYALLDPCGKLANARFNDAIVIAQRLVDQLPKEQRDDLFPLTKSIKSLREECLPYFQGSSKWGHERYIFFLEKVQQHLQIVHESGIKETAVDTQELELVADVEQELHRTDQEGSREAEHLDHEEADHAEELHGTDQEGSREAEHLDHEEADHAEELHGTDQEGSREAEHLDHEEADHAFGMTLDQIAFVSFLEALMALVQKAVALWKQSANKELPIRVAASRKWDLAVC